MGSPKVRDFHLSFVQHSHSQTYKPAYFSSTIIDHQLVETHSYSISFSRSHIGPYMPPHKLSLTSSKNMKQHVTILDHETVVDCPPHRALQIIPTFWVVVPQPLSHVSRVKPLLWHANCICKIGQ